MWTFKSAANALQVGSQHDRKNYGPRFVTALITTSMSPEYYMDAESRQRYIRWQDWRIKQLSFSINLFLGFAIASLGFAINLLSFGRVQNPSGLRLIIVLWAISAAFGVISTISRLLDFRYTARKIKDGGRFNIFMAKSCGPVAWGTFWCQVVLYVIGSYLFVIEAIKMPTFGV